MNGTLPLRRTLRLLQAVRIIHPFPTLMNVLTTGGLALIALRGAVQLAVLAHLMLAMFAIQSCIGITNDLADYELDRASKPDKPLAAGVLSARAARIAAITAFVAAMLLSMGFGAVAWLLAMAGLALGLAYDLRLKRTRASGLPLVMALPLLPLWIWVALDRFWLPLLAVIPLGCLLGLSLHLANSLTDFESDARGDVRGFAHQLGKRGALALCWGSFALTLVLVALSMAAIPSSLAVLLPGLGVATLCLALAILLYRVRPARESLQLGWGLLVTGSVVLALVWLGSFPAP